MHRDTRLIGALRINKKFNSEICSFKKAKSINSRRKDFYPKMMLSTKSTDEMVNKPRKLYEILKSKNVIEYNKYEVNIDITDQKKKL